jgi:ketosteroid isomerase-like protein
MMPADWSPEETLADFLAAFRRCDLDRMMGYFADDATAFAPVHHAPERLADREAIRAMFARVITAVQATGATEVSLNPTDAMTQTFGDIVMITLHLRGDRLGRRTFVLSRVGNGWQIVHLHASNG